MTDSWCDSEEARKALRDAIAREVMGWKAERIEWAYSGNTLVWHDSHGLPVITRYSWQPDLRDAQAMKVVDRMLELGFQFSMRAGEGFAIAAFDPGAAAFHGNQRDRCVAILQAALQAVSTIETGR